MDILNPNIVNYLISSSPERDAVLQDMEEYAHARNFPIVGPLVGRLLYSLAMMTQAKRIFEMGSGFGYSAYWFAKSMGKEGQIICTDGDEENSKHAAAYFQRGKITQRIDFRVGNGLKVIDETDGQFDIIFNDIDKRDYPKAFRKALPRLKKGGLLISDNVLWSGKVISNEPDKDTAGILTYNRLIYSSKELFSVIIPLRDGVGVTIKL